MSASAIPWQPLSPEELQRMLENGRQQPQATSAPPSAPDIGSTPPGQAPSATGPLQPGQPGWLKGYLTDFVPTMVSNLKMQQDALGPAPTIPAGQQQFPDLQQRPFGNPLFAAQENQGQQQIDDATKRALEVIQSTKGQGFGSTLANLFGIRTGGQRQVAGAYEALSHLTGLKNAQTNEELKNIQGKVLEQNNQLIATTTAEQDKGWPAQMPMTILAAMRKASTSEQNKILTLTGTLARNGQKLVDDGKGGLAVANMTSDEMPLPQQYKLKLAELTAQLKRSAINAAQYKPGTPEGDAANVKLSVMVQNARSQASRAASAAGMTQIAAAKFAEDYVSGYTDEEGNVSGINQARLKAMSGKIPPALAKAFGTFQTSKSRLNVMQESLPKGIAGDQQAMLNLLANHLGMTMGLQPGARMNQALIHEAEQSAPMLGRIQARFDDRGYLTGVTLTPEQMNSMVDLAVTRVDQDARAVSETEDYFGVHGRRSATPQTPQGGKVPVIRISDGQSGTIDAKDFDPKKYKKK